MTLLIVGLVLFFGVHLISPARGLRGSLIAKIGEGGYKGLYSLISLLGFGLICYGFTQAPFVAIWTPPLWMRHITMLLVPLALVLLLATYLPSNLRRLTAHPMLWGVTLWAVAHLLANGDLRSILLFASFAVYSLFAMFSQTQRGAASSQQKRPWWNDLLVVVLGLGLSGLLVKFHAALFGMPLIG